jgi:hypothetical protein
MRVRALLSSSSFALLLCSLGCGGLPSNGGAGPSGGADGGKPSDAAAPDHVAEGPARSGIDVRLPWVVTAGGGRVHEGEPVYAVGLSGTYGLPVYCAFGPQSAPTAVALVCVPQYPAAILDMVGNTFADASCGDDKRLFAESPAQRVCQGAALRFGVLAPPPGSACDAAVSVRELQPVATPQMIYSLQGGKCAAGGPGKATLSYYLTVKTIALSELPQGRRSLE